MLLSLPVILSNKILSSSTNTPRNYIYTHTRATPWLVGMTMGYVLYETRAWRREVAAGTKNGLSKVKNIMTTLKQG